MKEPINPRNKKPKKNQYSLFPSALRPFFLPSLIIWGNKGPSLALLTLHSPFADALFIFGGDRIMEPLGREMLLKDGSSLLFRKGAFHPFSRLNIIKKNNEKKIIINPAALPFASHIFSFPPDGRYEKPCSYL